MPVAIQVFLVPVPLPALDSPVWHNSARAFYQVRIGADTRPAADDLCNRIRRAGGACFVLRNMGVPG